MKYTEKEINLCKEIARYYRKPINEYEPVIASWPNVRDVTGLLLSKKDGSVLCKNKRLLYPYPFYPKKIIPLWTWEEAREWLRKRGGVLIDLTEWSDGRIVCEIAFNPEKHKDSGWSCPAENLITKEGKTDLEAILKVVLAVLKKEQE